MNLDIFLQKIRKTPDAIEFKETLSVIESNYHYTPCEFSNGRTVNLAGTNEGSCKIFYFAKLNKLTKEEALACFGHYYREDVLEHPEGDDHANIRNFIISGWGAVHFGQEALSVKSNV